MPPSQKISLQNRLRKAWLLFLLLLGLSVGCLFWYIISLQQQTVTSELHREAVLVEQMLEYRLLFNHRQASTIAGDSSLRVLLQLQLWSQLGSNLAEFSKERPIRAVWVLGRDESVKAASRPEVEDFCPMTLSGPSERLMVHKGRLNHLIRRAIHSRDNRLLGFLVIAFIYPEQSFLDQLGEDENQFIALVRGNEIVAASSDLDLGDLQASRLQAGRTIEVKVRTFPTTFLVEKASLTLYTWDLTLYLLRDLEPIQAPLHTLGLILGLFSLLVVCGSFLFYAYINRHVIHPITSLAQAAKKIRTTDSITPLKEIAYPSSSKDEIWDLINSFKTMVGYLNKARNEAESLSSMKDAFLATVSHEIRTPLNGIFGMTQLLQRSGLTPKQERYASNMIVSIHTLLSIINDVLDISKIKAKGFTISNQRVDLHQLLESVYQAHIPVAKAKGLEMRFETEPLPGLVMTDPLRLQQILNNLISNALKFTHSGYVLLAAKSFPDQDGPDTARVRFIVADSGIGIPEDKQASVFNAFSQVDSGLARKYPGTGLGLSIASELVSLLGGDRIFLHSNPGHGSRFFFSLGLKRCTETEPPSGSGNIAETTGATATAFSGLSILVAEDNPMNQELVLEIFELLGIENYHMCSNGQAALDSLASAPDRYDALILDIQMPGMDGFTVARTIRDHSNPIPIVAMTGLAGDKDKQRSRECGIDYFLSKPFSLEDLESILVTLVSRSAP
ncbi:hybrid sensor histidine kinase/response regulator [Desulfoplanes sp.]